MRSMFEISDSCVCCAAGKDDSDSRTSNYLLIFTCNSNRTSSSSMSVSHDYGSCLSMMIDPILVLMCDVILAPILRPIVLFQILMVLVIIVPDVIVLVVMVSVGMVPVVIGPIVIVSIVMVPAVTVPDVMVSVVIVLVVIDIVSICHNS